MGDSWSVEEPGAGNRDDEDDAQSWYLRSSAQFMQRTLVVLLVPPILRSLVVELGRPPVGGQSRRRPV